MKNRLDMAGWESIPIPMAMPTPRRKQSRGAAEQAVGADPLEAGQLTASVACGRLKGHRVGHHDKLEQ